MGDDIQTDEIIVENSGRVGIKKPKDFVILRFNWIRADAEVVEVTSSG